MKAYTKAKTTIEAASQSQCAGNHQKISTKMCVYCTRWKREETKAETRITRIEIAV